MEAWQGFVNALWALPQNPLFQIGFLLFAVYAMWRGFADLDKKHAERVALAEKAREEALKPLIAIISLSGERQRIDALRIAARSLRAEVESYKECIEGVFMHEQAVKASAMPFPARTTRIFEMVKGFCASHPCLGEAWNPQAECPAPKLSDFQGGEKVFITTDNEDYRVALMRNYEILIDRVGLIDRKLTVAFDKTISEEEGLLDGIRSRSQV